MVCMGAGCASTQSAVTMQIPNDRTPPDPPMLSAAEEQMRQQLKELRDQVRSRPKDPDLYYQIGVLEAGLGNFEEARKMFNKVLDLDINHAKAYYQIGLTWEHSGEMYVVAQNGRTVLPIQRERATAFYKKAIQSDPNFADAFYRLAVLALMGNNLDLASQASRELTRVEPNTDRSIAIMKQVFARYQQEQKH